MGDNVDLVREEVREEVRNLKRIVDIFLQKGDITRGYYDEAVSRFDNLLI